MGGHATIKCVSLVGPNAQGSPNREEREDEDDRQSEARSGR